MISHSTNAPPQTNISEWDLAVRPVKVELLDKEQTSLNVVATGFLFSENGEEKLYLPWHVVTGYSFPEVKVKSPPSRHYIRISTKQFNRLQPGNYSIGNTVTTTYPLYDEERKPIWVQEQLYRSHPDLETMNLRIPRYTDLVAIPVQIDAGHSRFICYMEEQTFTGSVQNGQEVVLTGYPWGYSALGDLTPEPLFIVRHIASWVLKDRPHDFLVDGVGARGMSGSPILIRVSNGFKLIGVYLGAVFPDVIETGKPQDVYSTLGVGVRFSSRHHFSRDHVLAPN